MCGIGGIISRQPVEAQVLRRMSEALSHRGPDDKGVWQDNGVALIHRRLSIVDLEGGHQPMLSEDGQLVVTFNGEIYNYPQLRVELENKGRRFRTRCDTEVLLHLYDEQGPQFVRRLRGMFAFAIFDARKRQVLLARDHLGQKPLFYWRDGSHFVFASEMKGLLTTGLFSAQVDTGTLWHHSALRFCPSDRTLLKGIEKVPPAHLILLDADSLSLQVKRYWDLDYSHKVSLSYEEATDKLEAILDQSVRMHLMSDVPVGSFLSGGVDSSLVTALAAKAIGPDFPTFSVGVGDSDFTELPYARQAADIVGSLHREFKVESDLMLLLPDILWHLEEPADSHAVGLYLLSQLAREHVKVVIGGDGADETFGGYLRFVQSHLLSAYGVIPASIRTRLLAPMLHLLPHNFSFYSWANKAMWAHQMSFLSGAERHYCAMTFFGFTEEQRQELFTRQVVQGLDESDTLHFIAKHYDSLSGADDVDRMLYTEQMTRMPEHFLQIADRMSMAHGLEMRAPLVDTGVVEFAAALPSEFKIRPGQLKIILREVARRHYPAKLINRQKMGFKFPMARWFKGSLAEFITDALDEGRMFQADLFDKEYVDSILEEHKSGKVDHNFKIWNLLNVEVWYRMFISGDSRDDTRQWLVDLLRTSGRAA